MSENDGFIYKRLSSGKEPFAGLGRRGPPKSAADEGSFFNFKFVNRKDGVSFLREKGRPGRKEDDPGDEKKRTRTTQVPRIVKFSAPAARDPRQLHCLLGPGDGIDALARLAVDFLRHKLRFPPFLDRLGVKIDVPEHDLEKQIAEVDAEVAEIGRETQKWGDVLDTTTKLNLVAMDFAFQDTRVDEIRARKERLAEIRRSFSEKEAVLVTALRGLEKAVEDVQSHCEGLFRKVLRTVERSSGYDSHVLLRAISKLGR